MTGYRRFGQRLEGHPTPILPWVDVATGSLGQGLPDGVGVALAGKYLDRLPFRVWVLCGDSELAEGSIWEAFDKASYYQLSNLVVMADINRLGQRGPTDLGWDLTATSDAWRRSAPGCCDRRARPVRDRQGDDRCRGETATGPRSSSRGHQGQGFLRGREQERLARKAVSSGHGRPGDRRARRGAQPGAARTAARAGRRPVPTSRRRSREQPRPAGGADARVTRSATRSPPGRPTATRWWPSAPRTRRWSRSTAR